MTEAESARLPISNLRLPSAAPLAASRTAPRWMRYIISRGWIHLLALSLVAVFLFPFAYMFLTSLKTDEELTDPGSLAAIPTFQSQSPRVRDADPITRPPEASEQTFNAVLPTLRQLTRNTVDAAPLPPGGDAVDINHYRASVTDILLTRLIPRINPDLWRDGDVAKIVDAYKAGLTPDVITAAFDNRLARLELRGLQARSLDSHIYNLTPGDAIATTWTIESGDARFIPAKSAAILGYHFNSGGDAPITLRCEFDYPADPAKLHKLMFALKPDDSWHQVDATLDFAGNHWISNKTKYLGTTRAMSILFQPPSFDDTTDRKRIWVPMKLAGAAPTSLDPKRGVLRVTISPSSTIEAIIGKVRRNYDRVFESVPFWRYVANSLFIVALATVGTMFSASFVAYAFARLHWPGRTIAFGILLSTMMLPAQVTMIASFLIWRTLGLYNTLCPLWLPAWFGTAFFIFLMTQHMRTIPRELEEAARIDGASVFRTWRQIILPECKPALAAIAIMVFMAAWNDFMGPLIYLRDQTKFPLSLGLFAIRLDTPEGGIDWTMIMAGNVLMTLPVLIVFFIFQRYFIQGMTMSGMKG